MVFFGFIRIMRHLNVVDGWDVLQVWRAGPGVTRRSFLIWSLDWELKMLTLKRPAYK
jgi:hypothetical protein